MKWINKFFVFCSIVFILISCATPFTQAETNYDKYAKGCDTKTPYTSVTGSQNDLVAKRVFEYYSQMQFSNTSLTSNFAGPYKYNVDANSFKCSMADVKAAGVSNLAEYKEIMVNYYYKDEHETMQLAHTTIFTDYPFAIEDVHIDIDGGRLVISNLMSNDKDVWNQIFSNLSAIITGISGIGILCCLLAFIIQILRLGMSAGNPAERERAVSGLLWTGIGTAGCGAAAFIFGLVYNLL